MPFLYAPIVLLAAAVIVVPLVKRLGFGNVLGYLVAGLIIGPAGLRLVSDVESIAEVSELGVVMLLFLIGLELRPAMLWRLRGRRFDRRHQRRHRRSLCQSGPGAARHPVLRHGHRRPALHDAAPPVRP